jgi:hypothetical protein
MNAQTAYSAHPIHSYIFSAVENAFEIEHNKKIVQFSSGTPEERKAFLDGFARLQAPFKPPESSSQVNIGKIPGNILIDTDVSAMQTEATIRGAEEEKKSRRRSASPEPFRVRAVLSREREREVISIIMEVQMMVNLFRGEKKKKKEEEFVISAPTGFKHVAA